MSVLTQIARFLPSKHPIKELLTHVSRIKTVGDAISTVKHFFKAKDLANIIVGIHKQYEVWQTKAPAGHTVEFTIKPDIKEKQLKLSIQHVKGNERVPVKEILAKDVTVPMLEKELMKVIGEDKRNQPFSISSLLTSK